MAVLCGLAFYYQWESSLLNISIEISENDEEFPSESTSPEEIITENSADSGETEQTDKSGLVHVPNVVGKEQLEAAAILEQLGLGYIVSTNGEGVSEYYYIVEQSIPDGIEVPIGTEIELTLAPLEE